jgi:hypothetical protein
MLEFALAMKLLAQQPPAADHVLRLQQSAQLQVRTVPAERRQAAQPAGEPATLTRTQRRQLRQACERFVEEHATKVHDLR